jgi:hypothetical protein
MRVPKIPSKMARPSEKRFYNPLAPNKTNSVLKAVVRSGGITWEGLDKDFGSRPPSQRIQFGEIHRMVEGLGRLGYLYIHEAPGGYVITPTLKAKVEVLNAGKILEKPVIRAEEKGVLELLLADFKNERAGLLEELVPSKERDREYAPRDIRILASREANALEWINAIETKLGMPAAKKAARRPEEAGAPKPDAGLSGEKTRSGTQRVRVPERARPPKRIEEGERTHMEVVPRGTVVARERDILRNLSTERGWLTSEAISSKTGLEIDAVDLTLLELEKRGRVMSRPAGETYEWQLGAAQKRVHELISKGPEPERRSSSGLPQFIGAGRRVEERKQPAKRIELTEAEQGEFLSELRGLYLKRDEIRNGKRPLSERGQLFNRIDKVKKRLRDAGVPESELPG